MKYFLLKCVPGQGNQCIDEGDFQNKRTAILFFNQVSGLNYELIHLDGDGYYKKNEITYIVAESV